MTRLAGVRRLALHPPHGWTAAWVLLSAATAVALCSTGLFGAGFAADVSAAVLPAGYPYIEVVACPSDLAAVRRELAPRYTPVAQGDAYTILART